MRKITVEVTPEEYELVKAFAHARRRQVGQQAAFLLLATAEQWQRTREWSRSRYDRVDRPDPDVADVVDVTAANAGAVD